MKLVRELVADHQFPDEIRLMIFLAACADAGWLYCETNPLANKRYFRHYDSAGVEELLAIARAAADPEKLQATNGEAVADDVAPADESTNHSSDAAPHGWFEANDLADTLRAKRDTVRKRLERWRSQENTQHWKEIDDRNLRNAQYHYWGPGVWTLLVDLKDSAT